jgi:hypothetical protein
MRLPLPAALLAATAVLAIPAAAAAHFILLSPASAIKENRLGDPQKAFPCGTNETIKAEPSGAVTALAGGELLKIRVQETVYHPGFYRVALAVNDLKELPADPETVTRQGTRGPISVSGKIDPNPKAPVVADGLFQHTSKVAAGEISEAYIKVPNINCVNCTMQVVQWMGEHGPNMPGDYTYHHCATVTITASKHMPIDKAWPKQVKAKMAAKK